MDLTAGPSLPAHSEASQTGPQAIKRVSGDDHAFSQVVVASVWLCTQAGLASCPLCLGPSVPLIDHLCKVGVAPYEWEAPYAQSLP